MKDILPCPYCGGEVEMVKLPKKPGEKKNLYRIECRMCRKLVTRGLGFPIETPKDAEKRIRQYEEVISKIYYPVHTTKVRQSAAARHRDKIARSYMFEE